MLVFGDPADLVDAREALRDVELRVVRGDGLGALIEAGRLAQALLDGEQQERGCDEDTVLSRTCMSLLLGLAGAVSREDEKGSPKSLKTLTDLVPGTKLSLKVPEGYAFYAVYPQLYAEAAKRLEMRVQAVGVRSIGASLAAVVAAAVDGPPPISVRPVGHPFDRRLSLSRRIDPSLHYAVVDEGPGLSGSSFIAVADALLERGVPLENIVIFPSHTGAPGPQAPARVRELWPLLHKMMAGFDEVILPQLTSWVADLTGPALEPLQDLSGGAWRKRLHGPWPPANVQQERRKYLLRSERGQFLLKFAGLGRSGEETHRRARAVAEAGFGPEVLGLRKGFLVQRWVDGAREPGPRADEVARYLAFRSQELPARAGSGASPEHLLEMAEHNAGRAFPELRARLSAMHREAVPVEVDGRMHRWEWLRDFRGSLLKTDAADHCRSHDLAGCQDIAWDLAGASVELGLDEDELVKLFRAHGGRGAAPDVLAFLRPCYLALQLGAHRLAAQSLPGEAARLDAAADRYALLLSARP